MVSTSTLNLTGCDIDSDGDNYTDCVDACPFDSSLQVMSTCGCQPQAACNCTQQSCPAVEYSGTSSVSTSSGETTRTNITVSLVPNSTATEVALKTSDQTLDMTLGWGVISEVTTSGKVIKTVDPISGNWTRIITTNETVIVAEYHSNRFAGSMWPDPNLHIALITQITLDSLEEQIKFSVQVEGDWGFADVANKLRVEFNVDAPVRERALCDTKQSWEVTSTDMENTYRFYLANETATTLGFLKHCTLDGVALQPAHVSDPELLDDMSGWTTIVEFPSFSSRLYYDPSFALLLGYSDEQCGPLLAWILPVSFIAGAGTIILIFVVLIYFPPTARLLMGERSYQIHGVRNDIKKDFRREKSTATLPSVTFPLAGQQQAPDDGELRVITSMAELEEL